MIGTTGAPGTLWRCSLMRAMTSRRLVVWISTGILGFQGATLAFDLLNCTALSWLVLHVNGRQVVVRGLRWADTEGVRNATDHLRRQNKERDFKTLALELN